MGQEARCVLLLTLSLGVAGSRLSLTARLTCGLSRLMSLVRGICPA